MSPRRDRSPARCASLQLRQRVVDRERQAPHPARARHCRWRARPDRSSLRKPVMHARQHGGEREIRIGIRARDAMLDAARICRPGRNAQARRTVVDAPAAVDRREHVGLEAAIGIHIRREQRHRFRHQRLQARRSRDAAAASLLGCRCRKCCGPLVEHAHMDVQTRCPTSG